jgi:MtfA peptidase
MTRLFDWLRGSRVRPEERLPDEWASFLWDYSAHYRRLPSGLAATFERDVQRVITTQRITGVEMEADDRLRLLVAASAATLSLGWPGYKWSEVSEVLLYPDSFDHDYAIGRPELAGVAHLWGTVILSVPALWQSFEHSEDAFHVGLHEFAHLLTFEGGRYVDIPVGLRPDQVRLWEAIQAHELKRVTRGESVVQMLGLLTGREFFPSAVEAFFQKPVALRNTHQRLYRFLRRYFAQDPATWESRYREDPSA